MKKKTCLDLLACLATAATLSACGAGVDVVATGEGASVGDPRAAAEGETLHTATLSGVVGAGEERSLCQYVQVGPVDATTVHHIGSAEVRSVVLRRTALEAAAVENLGDTFDCAGADEAMLGGVLCAATGGEASRDFGADGAVHFGEGEVVLVEIVMANPGAEAALGVAVVEIGVGGLPNK